MAELQTPSQPAPSPFDTDFAAFAESLELALASFHEQAIAKLTGEAIVVSSRFADHHREHARAFAALAGAKATGKANGVLVFTTAPGLGALGDASSVLARLVDLENQMAETYAAALPLLTDANVYQRVVETLPVESAHAALLGSTAGLPLGSLFTTGSFENASVGDGSDPRRGFDMATFPVG
jgi:hypothetical protein